MGLRTPHSAPFEPELVSYVLEQPIKKKRIIIQTKINFIYHKNPFQSKLWSEAFIKITKFFKLIPKSGFMNYFWNPFLEGAQKDLKVEGLLQKRKVIHEMHFNTWLKNMEVIGISEVLRNFFGTF